jgi:hypothetical protein
VAKPNNEKNPKDPKNGRPSPSDTVTDDSQDGEPTESGEDVSGGEEPGDSPGEQVAEETETGDGDQGEASDTENADGDVDEGSDPEPGNVEGNPEGEDGEEDETDPEAQPGFESEEEPQEPLQSRMGLQQAILVLRTLLERSEDRRQQQALEEGASEEVNLDQQNAQAVVPIIEMAYVSFDGDSIGNRVAQFEENDDEEGLSQVSDAINAGQDLFKQWAQRFGGKVIEQGGDEGLAKVPAAALEDLENFRQQYAQLVGATVTCGVGSSLSQSTRARELGKLRGKDQTVEWFDGLDQELEARLEDEGPQDERSKIQAAGLARPVDHGSIPKWGVPPESFDQVDDDAEDEENADAEGEESDDENADEEESENEEDQGGDADEEDEAAREAANKQG